MPGARKVEGFVVTSYVVLVLFALLCILPFYYVLTVSVSDPAMVREGHVTLLPRGFSLAAYKIILRQPAFRSAYQVTVTRTAIGTVLDVALQAMMAYALSKRTLRGRKGFVFLVVFTMLFSGGMIPTYLIVRYTRLLNTIWALVIPGAISAYNVIILMSFFSSIPESIEESARIDGANDVLIFSRLVVPLSAPAIATITLFNAVRHWNALMDGVLYINKPSLKPLQVYLTDIVMQARMEELFASDAERAIPSLSIQTAAIFATVFSILLVYPFVQRYFTKGIVLGAIKG